MEKTLTKYCARCKERKEHKKTMDENKREILICGTCGRTIFADNVFDTLRNIIKSA